ncbi:MAG TPA: AI-2E family transporter [Stellaceae bacterium]|nr:AI-2E family transporter [Stellaceae bacterium]
MPARRVAEQPRSPASGWALTAILAVVAVIVYIIRYYLLPFVFAIAIAFIVEPVVRLVQRRTGWRRWIVAAVLSAAIVVLLLAVGYWIGTTAIGDLQNFAKTAPETLTKFVGAIVGQHITMFGHTYTPKELVHTAGAWVAAALGGKTFLSLAMLGFGSIVGCFLTLVLIPYMMISGPRLSNGAIWLIPPERRHSVTQLLPKMLPALRRYLAGILGVVAYTAVIAYIGFGLVFGLPNAVLLSITVGVLELIPAAGPFASGVLVALTAFQQKSMMTIILMGAFAIALRLSIDNLIAPIVLGKAGRIHPVIVIFSFIAGASLFGLIGLILAVPAAVCLRLILQHYYAEPVRKEAE